MQFQVRQTYTPFTVGFKIKAILRGFLTLFYLPFEFARHLFQQLFGIKEPVGRPENVWLHHEPETRFDLRTFALDNETSENLVEAGELAFPEWKDWNDPFRLMIRIRTNPKLPDLEQLLFDEVLLTAEPGTFAIRINPKDQGMTLCLFTHGQLTEITALKSLSWNFTRYADHQLILTAYADQGKYEAFVSISEEHSLELFEAQ